MEVETHTNSANSANSANALLLNLMSTTSHKSRTRKLSEVAMKSRVHSPRKERDLTADGLDKHHHEATSLKARAKSTKVKTAASAKTAVKAAKATKAASAKKPTLAKTGRVATAGRVRK
jgi:hypothetical protein